MIIFANNFQEVNWNENLYKKTKLFIFSLNIFLCFSWWWIEFTEFTYNDCNSNFLYSNYATSFIGLGRCWLWYLACLGCWEQSCRPAPSPEKRKRRPIHTEVQQVSQRSGRRRAPTCLAETIWTEKPRNFFKFEIAFLFPGMLTPPLHPGCQVAETWLWPWPRECEAVELWSWPWPQECEAVELWPLPLPLEYEAVEPWQIAWERSLNQRTVWPHTALRFGPKHPIHQVWPYITYCIVIDSPFSPYVRLLYCSKVWPQTAHRLVPIQTTGVVPYSPNLWPHKAHKFCPIQPTCVAPYSP